MSDKKFVITNISLYLSIAEDAAKKSLDHLNAGQRPKPNGEAGFILAPDPAQTSFREAMIAIAFSGMYLEAFIRIETRRAREEGRRYISKADERGRYGGMLEAIGLKDPALVKEADRFNDVRDDLVHEMPVFFFNGAGSPKHVFRWEAFHRSG